MTGKVVLGNPAVAADSPLGRTGVTYKLYAAPPIIPDGHHGMAADAGLTPEGKRHETSVHDDEFSKDP